MISKFLLIAAATAGIGFYLPIFLGTNALDMTASSLCLSAALWLAVVYVILKS